MTEDINKQLLCQFYGFNDSKAINNLSTSKAIESYENVADIEYLNTEQVLSSEETGKNQNTEEESENITDENNDSNLLKSPHVLTIEQLFEQKEKDVQESHAETDIIGDVKDDKNIPSKTLTRLEDTFSKAMAKVSETPSQVNVNSAANETTKLSSGPVKKAKKLWRQKTILSKENIINTPNLLSKYNGISLNLNNFGIFDFPIDLLDKLKNLQMLYLDSNNLSEIPDQLFVKLKNLKWLDVRNNQLLTIPLSVKGHASLETLLLQGNNIERLPLELGLIPNLKNLQLAHNPIKFPPPEILDLDSYKIVNFLRTKWNKEHPNEVIELKKDSNKIEKKPSTIICYQPSSKKHFKTKKNIQTTPKISVRTRSWNYKPSSRCQSAGGNPIYQQKIAWMETAKELLENQAAELQKTINKSVLDKWRFSCKSMAKKSANLKSQSFERQRLPPFALHEEICENNAHAKMQNFQIKSQYINSDNFKENFDKLLESLKKLDDARVSGNMTPQTEKKNLQTEIQKINQLQRQLQNLKTCNQSYMGPLKNENN